MRNAMRQRSSSRRQTGRSPRARTASTRPRSISFWTTFCAAPPLRLGGRSSRCEAADRTIHWVSVSLVADMVGILRCRGATLAPSPPQPRFGIEPAGQDPGQAVTPGRRHYRSVRSRMPVLSATIFDAVFVRAGFGTCLLGTITVWLPVRVLPAPPRSPALTPSSPSPRNTLDFRGLGLEKRGRGILLLHDIQRRTTLALPRLLAALKAQNYHVVHVVPAASGVGDSGQLMGEVGSRL